MFLFSFLSLLGCEQIAELGKPVAFASQEQVIEDAPTTENLDASKEQVKETKKEEK